MYFDTLDLKLSNFDSVLCSFHYKNVVNLQNFKLKPFNIRLRKLLSWLDLTAKTKICSKH